MKQETKASPRAIALLLATAALPATPALAQDIAPLPTPAQAPAAVAAAPVTPPPVVRTALTPVPTSVAPPPVVSTAPAEVAPAAEPVRRATRTPARARPVPARRAPVAEAAPVAAAAADIAPTPAPPVVEPVTPAPVESAAPAPAETTPPAQTGNGGAIWPWILAGIALLAAIGGLIAWRRRKAEAEYDPAYFDEDVAAQPVIEAAPVAAPLSANGAWPVEPIAPAALEPATKVAIEDVTVSEAGSAEVDAIMAASAPQHGRPWLELAMLPVRAGTSDDDAVVEFELTVGNTGDVAAKDVRISTWMFTAEPGQSDNEQTLLTPPADATLAEVTIAPGDGKTVDAAVALPKSGLHVVGGGFTPVVVADARYRLPDGSEGRISASFEFGLNHGEGAEMTPFFANGAPEMHSDIEARLHGELQRA